MPLCLAHASQHQRIHVRKAIQVTRIIDWHGCTEAAPLCHVAFRIRLSPKYRPHEECVNTTRSQGCASGHSQIRGIARKSSLGHLASQIAQTIANWYPIGTEFGSEFVAPPLRWRSGTDDFTQVHINFHSTITTYHIERAFNKKHSATPQSSRPSFAEAELQYTASIFQ